MILLKENRESGVSLKQVRELFVQYFSKHDVQDKKILVLIPDNTRSGPIGEIFKCIYEEIGQKVKALDVLVALGTHQPLSEKQICKRLSMTIEERSSKYSKVKFFNHEWDKQETFKTIDRITSEEIEELSNGLFSEEVDVKVNKMIFEYDEVFIAGPVFPHEVVGFSGGHKYIFPGIAGQEIIDFFHWLGAVITNPEVNGNKWTAPRKVVEKAASFINVPSQLIGVVALDGDIKGIYAGDVIKTWEKAADMSKKIHIAYMDKQYGTVLGIAPEMYDDIWTAGKVMYKLEPVVKDGGDLIIYAPHIDEVSYTHGHILDKIGYHTRDYYLKQKNKFKDIPGGVKAHSTHVKGIGKFENGTESPRINVILATKIPQERCERINLGYMNPDEINIRDYENREDEGILVVHHAGEVLHRLQ